MKQEKKEFQCKPLLYNGNEVTMRLEKGKKLTIKDGSKEIDVTEGHWVAFLGKLISINNEAKIPLNWKTPHIKILLHIFAALGTFSMMNYLLFFFTKVKLNYLDFVFSLTWMIIVLIPASIVVLKMFSQESLHQAKMHFLKDTLPLDVGMVCFVTSFYNTLNRERFLSESDQSLRNALVNSRDIFETEGLKILAKDFEVWLKKNSLGIKIKG